jgi:putative lipase involved disintegration of autophagic bodies
MHDAWDEVKGSVIAILQTAQSTYPSYKITTTGHPLGGGLSYVAAAELRKVGFVVVMVCLTVLYDRRTC